MGGLDREPLVKVPPSRQRDTSGVGAKKQKYTVFVTQWPLVSGKLKLRTK